MILEKKEIQKYLENIVGAGHLLVDEPMAKHISFRVGGPADFFVLPQDTQELEKVLAFCRAQELAHYLKGNGSNLLVRDGGYRGIIIETKALSQIQVTETAITAGPGALLRDVADVALEHALTGMEFASGIPGSIGGAVVMNAGAYDGEMKDIVEGVTVIKKDGTGATLDLEGCNFGYRQSSIQEQGWVVTGVKLRLRDGDYNTIQGKMKDFNDRRRSKQPLEYPSAGSTFRRPAGYFAGKLIQDSGMQGATVGGARVSEKHAGFVINGGDATARDIQDLIAKVQSEVLAQYGVALRTEVIMIGEECD